MKILNTLLTLTLVFKFLQHERNKSYEEYLTKRATQKPLEHPNSSSSSIRTYNTIKPLTNNPRSPYSLSINPNTGIITSTTTTSKYTPEQLQSFYKINPYTNFN